MIANQTAPTRHDIYNYIHTLHTARGYRIIIVGLETNRQRETEEEREREEPPEAAASSSASALLIMRLLLNL